MNITAYSISSGFANVIDSISIERPTDSEVIYDELQLVLPDGYTLEDTEYGPGIFDADGNHCELCYNNRRQKVISVVSTSGCVAIKRAPEGQKSVALRDARLAANLTQRQLADAAGVNIRLVQKVEGGEAEAGNLTAKNLLALADALGVDPRDLIKADLRRDG